MTITAEKTKRSVVQFLILLMFFFAIALKAQGQALADTSPAAKEIISVMDNSAKEWNEGKLGAFMNLYDPSATMMSYCLFPDTKKQ
jgi:hypothetical protein